MRDYYGARERYCFMRDCKVNGLTWADIGLSLDVTAIAARKWFERWAPRFTNGAEHMAGKANGSGVRGIAAQLKRDIREAGYPKASGVPWPEDLRNRIVAFADEVGGVSKAANELGINAPTINGWIKYNRVKREPMRVSPAVEKQAIAPRRTPAPREVALSTVETATVVGPGGFRVEGLSLRNAAELLKHLEA